MNARFLSLADTALCVEFGDRIDPALNRHVLQLNALVRAAGLPGVVETIPTFRSLLIRYDPLATDSASLVAGVENLLDSRGGDTKRATLWRIPACYSARHGADLDAVARATRLSTDEVIRLHSSVRYQVYMVGFVPGYPYMGDLPEPLALPRRTDPRVRVPAGSIAIAASMTAIYPVESPGGWHLIGATPVRLFDSCRPRPALLSPGDMVHFESITAREFDAVRAAVSSDSYQIPYETIEAGCRQSE